MTVGQLLTLIDCSQKNDQPDEVKIMWIRDVEGRVLSEIHGIPLEKVLLPQGENDVLTLPESYTRVYLLYVAAMIEFFGGNSLAYTRLHAEFEAALAMYARYFIRNRK